MSLLTKFLSLFRRPEPARLKLDSRDEYWREAAMCALEPYLNLDRISPIEWDYIAASLALSAECQSMAFGHDCIPNPLDAEVRELKTKLKANECAHEEREREWSKATAEALRVRSGRRVFLRDGELEVDP